MVFSSPAFLFAFLPLVLLLYYAVPQGWRNGLLLTTSLFFYAWGELTYVGVMLGSIALNHLAALGMMCQPPGRGRKLALTLGVGANLGLLAAFKYADFLTLNLNGLLGAFGAPPLPLPHTHLPLGISFFTFQALSYLVDCYREETPVERNPLRLGLYIALFPQLIAGPIVRYHDVQAQIRSRRHDGDRFAYGTWRFILGLGKKVLIADPLGQVADGLFALPPGELTAPLAWAALLAFSLQIYFDFSGYSDMAIGLGRLFGFRFLENFDHPYVAQSVREFWRRWHISLSTWFRDYLYIPLGGNRGSRLRTAFNLVLVFLLCGLWHGASWNFALWGGVHGAFMSLERLGLERWLAAAWRPLRHLYALSVVTLAWVFFRIEDLPNALQFLSALGGGNPVSPDLHPWPLYIDHQALWTFLAGALLSLPVYSWASSRSLPPGLRHGVLHLAWPALVFALALFKVAASTYSPFIYFRF